MIKQSSALTTGENFQWAPQLEASDLRVGNKIYKDFEKVCTVLGVIADKEKPNESHVWTDNTKHGRVITDFYPIPLTPELLEKCGFEKDNGGFYERYEYKEEVIGNLYINWDQEEGLFLGYDANVATMHLKKTMNYLHQLQNLYFALTGEELQVNL